MSEATMQRSLGTYKRLLLVLGAAMAAISMYIAAAAPSALAAESFCTRAYLQPFGHNGDRCWAPGHTNLFGAAIETYERAGCVDIANGSNQLMFSWVCGAANSFPAPAAEIFDIYHEGVFRKGVIRNNNLSFAAYFNGYQSLM